MDENTLEKLVPKAVQVLVKLTLILASVATMLTSAGAQTEPAPLKVGVRYTNYGLATIRKCELGENLPPQNRSEGYCGHRQITRYFDAANPQDLRDRESLRVVIRGGMVFLADQPTIPHPDGIWAFVMDPSGNFYVFAKGGQNQPLHHSSFFQVNGVPQPIPSGGNLQIKSGRIVGISSWTGHYEMNDMILNNAIQALGDDGVDVVHLQRLHLL